MTNQELHKEAYEQTKFVKNIWDIENPVVLYENFRLRRVNFAFLICITMSVLSTYFVLSMSEETLTNEFSSLLTGRIWQFVFLILGNIMLVIMLRYKNRYITKVELEPYKQVKITTWNIGKRTTTTHDVLEFKSMDFHEGQTILPSVPLVHAPYLVLKVHNGRTYLLDMQGNFPKGYHAIHKVFNP